MNTNESESVLNEIAAAIKACEQGDDLGAEKRLQQKIVDIRRQVETKEAVSADLMHALANVCRDQYRFCEADGFYQRAIELRYQIDPNYRRPGILRLLRDFSTSLCMQGKFSEAFKIEEAALDIADSKAEKSQFESNMSLTRLCALSWVTRDFANAERYYKRCLDNRQSLVGAEEASLLPLLQDLAFICHQASEFESAADYYRRALSILPDTEANYGQRALLLNGLGFALCAQGKHADGQQVCHSASEKRSALPDEQPAHVLNDLADVYCHKNRFEEAKPLCQASYLAQHPSGVAANAPLWQMLTAYVETIKRLNFCERTDKMERRIAKLKLQALAPSA